MSLIPLSLYIHIPWCVQKCPYCDFNSHNIKATPNYQGYIDHLIQDLQSDLPLVKNRVVQTIFIGGGTPSLLVPELVSHLLTQISHHIEISQNAEITIEANPNSVEATHFEGYLQAGVNRISIGVQSFQSDKLTRLGRIHTANEAITAIKLAHTLPLSSFNIDLMHGLPNQTPQDAFADLDNTIALSPPHLSWYQLTIEPNTLFGSKPPKLPDEDSLWDIYQEGHQRLVKNGYQQYEISAYAKQGFQCLHNLNYWRFGDYLGIGCGAHGKLTQECGKIIRTIKTKHPKGYLTGRYKDQMIEVNQEELPFEFFMNRFRLLEATPKSEFTARTFLPLSTIEKPIEQCIKQGYVIETHTHWQLTEKGKLFLNSLLEIFL